ncbi:CRAL/TRIO domain [Nesidiocoris tenuis]|uniref:CRAL/TRIO domain n=1 Tax=Nesidiocoris tenuis TaxID=355587 RepID=A0ABN7B6H1_9HEMI|nr:CRAL/TRIO domain [Nesidiocoris tenuis]
MLIKDHPFKNGGEPIPKERKDDVVAVRNWLKHQEYLPQISDQFIMLFLHSNYYSVEKTKNTIDSYFTVRAETPELFSGWDFDSIQWKNYEFAMVPKKTQAGYKVLVYRLVETDPSKFNLQDGLKAFFAFNDATLSEDGLCPGYIVILDMKGCSLGHLARVSTQMQHIRTFMIYIQECHPARLKGVHVINSVSFIDKVLSLVKPLMQSELVQLLHVHSDLDTLKPFVPLDLLPEDYGGDAKPFTHLHEEFNKKMGTEYKQWLKDSEKIIADLKKRPKKKIINSMEGSFKTLSID